MPDDTAPLRGCQLDAIRRRVEGARDSDCRTTAEEDREVLLGEVDRLASLTFQRRSGDTTTPDQQVSDTGGQHSDGDQGKRGITAGQSAGRNPTPAEGSELASSHASEHGATEGLRERLVVAIRDAKCDHGLGQFACAHCRVDAVLAELVGDPGNLPKRMAAEMRRHHVVDDRTCWDCVCGATDVDWDAHLAAAALGVRDEQMAATVAEVVQALARAEHSEGEHQVTRERLASARQSLERQKAIVQKLQRERDDAQRRLDDADKDREDDLDAAREDHAAEVRDLEAEAGKLRAARDAAEARVAEYENALSWQTSCLACAKVLDSSIAEHERAIEEHDRADKAEAQVAALREELAGAREANADLDELIKSERKIHEQTTAERDHLSSDLRDFMRRNTELNDERHATVTAIYVNRIAHIREAHPTRIVAGNCVVCRSHVSLSAALPSRPDDPEEIRRLAQATESTEEKQ